MTPKPSEWDINRVKEWLQNNWVGDWVGGCDDANLLCLIALAKQEGIAEGKRECAEELDYANKHIWGLKELTKIIKKWRTQKGEKNGT